MHKRKNFEKEKNMDQTSLGRWDFAVHKIIQCRLGDNT